MNYRAMPGSILIKVDEQEHVKKSDSGLLYMVESTEKRAVTVSEIIAVGDDREDLKPGMKIVFPTNTGLKIDKHVYYLKYEDICAVLD